MEHLFGLLLIAWWIGMIADCTRNEPDRETWLWIVILLSLPGALAYFAVRFLPRHTPGFAPTNFLKRWTRSRELQAAESAARTIGKAHHFMRLGQLYRELALDKKAARAFDRAVEKEPNNLDALWERARTRLATGDPAKALEDLEHLLELDPAHKFGDASLALGQALVLTGYHERAREHLENHLERWSHPVALVLLASVLIRLDEKEEARKRLLRAIDTIRSGPSYYYRNHRAVLSQAKRMLRRT